MITEDYLRLIRKAIETTKDVEPTYRVAAFQEILGHLLNEAGAGPDSAYPHSEFKEDHSESIGEVLTRMGSNAQTDVTLVMAYYLLRYRNINSFTANDIDSLYGEARQPKTNTNLAIIGNVKKGFMVDTTEKRAGLKVFTISRLGERHVESKLIKGQSAGG